MSPGQFKGNDSYFGPLSEYLKTTSGVELVRMMMGTDAALNLPPEIQSKLKDLDFMQVMAFDHACLIGWRAAIRFMQDSSVPAPISAKPREQFASDPRVVEIDAQIEAHRKQLESQQQAAP